jgi:hypothetical protein
MGLLQVSVKKATITARVNNSSWTCIGTRISMNYADCVDHNKQDRQTKS